MDANGKTGVSAGNFVNMDWKDHPRRIVEFAGGRYLGEQETAEGAKLHLFSEPVTGTTLAVAERTLTIARVREKIERARAEFGRGGAEAAA